MNTGKKSRLLFTGNDSVMYESVIEDVYEDCSKDKEMLDFSIIQLSQNVMIIQTNSDW